MTLAVGSAAEQLFPGVDLSGKRAVVTGTRTASALAAAGAEVTLAVGDLMDGYVEAAAIRASTGAEVQVEPLNLVSPSSVRAFVANWTGPLHVLVADAGTMRTSLARTPEGWEMHFAANHLGHFALVTGLLPALADAGGAHVAFVRPEDRFAPVAFDDVHFDERPFDWRLAYAQSQTANGLFASAATRRWAQAGVVAGPGIHDPEAAERLWELSRTTLG